ncbi:LEAF RUST 10 DISEASE-RESISTANCE LOCUS RECEPTOR-LIKE PROTEIN KINASE-like [Canna indica]|uniref:LEAF RUST 10 DISEASE-RESISTANCE LOCUS RECEPTOR-LIKE PROTEIN KINASE-like n=1 Tax=Canna indica TaxID=4628 RepID=A0AAQ3JWZ6_9LILI|nr:LEAF RUST 10 DISEASE-RESISTANCE LOCUS RECEPTOR-LIKE PROTEIN KINASE-like [Canna indica]
MHPKSLPKFARLLPIIVLSIHYISCQIKIGSADKSAEVMEGSCEPMSCGTVTNISYPFWLGGEQPPYCGHPHFELRCTEDKHVLFQLFHKEYVVQQISHKTNSLWLVDPIFNSYKFEKGQECPITKENIDLDITQDYFIISRANKELIFYKCETRPPKTFNDVHPTCNEYLFIRYGGNYSDVLPPNVLPECESLHPVPVIAHDDEEKIDYDALLSEGFLVEWDDCKICRESGDKCEYDNSLGRPSSFYYSCSNYESHCPENINPAKSHNHRHPNWRIVTGIRVGLIGLAVAGFVCLLYIHCRKRKHSGSSTLLSQTASSFHTNSYTDPELGDEQFHTQIFMYEELVDATDGFSSSNELGDGGFGTVYKGKLRDGRTVAIKRFKNNYRRIELFMNEIYILSSFRHQNLVSLYGCISRHARELLLVYEYVPNGTVADHLHGARASEEALTCGARASEEALTWPRRMRIATETAEALCYLHAVTPQIIHRDVKTTNILLDRSFHVKVADFGLSRLFPVNVTHISTAPQGTPGYLDPEYHHCYRLTDKSDVYSFGVVLVELISSKSAVDVNRERQDINLSKMAIRMIQNQELEQLVDANIWFQSNAEMRTMIEQVAEIAFRCLQAEREMRPTMKEVLEALREIAAHEGYGRDKGVEADVAVDDEESLLRKKSSQSPDTVIEKWESSSTTPNSTG